VEINLMLGKNKYNDRQAGLCVDKLTQRQLQYLLCSSFTQLHLG